MTETLEMFRDVGGQLVVAAAAPSVHSPSENKQDLGEHGAAIPAALNGQNILPGDSTNRFDGDTFDARKDGARLTGQLKRVRDLMSDGAWRCQAKIACGALVPLSTVGSRIRDLRKAKFGLYTVNTRRLTNGLWEYQLGGKGL